MATTSERERPAASAHPDEGHPQATAGRRTLLRRIWDWRHDAMLARHYGNTVKLLTGHGSSALIGLATTWFMTASLGLWGFGILMAILGFTSLVGNLLKFSTWEAVVKYGADDLARSDHDACRRLVAFTTLLDIGTALMAVAVCAGLSGAILPVIGVPGDFLSFALFMSISAFFTISATPIGVLRLFDRFGLLALADPVGPALRMVLCAAGYHFGWSIWAFGAVWLASSAVDRLITVWLGWRELQRRDLAPTWRDFLARKSEGHPGLWKFALANNARVTLGVVTKQSDDLVVAAFAGPVGVALWRIAKRVSSVLGGPARLFVVSIYPQLARLWSARDYRGFRRLIVRASTTSTAGAILVFGLFALLGPWLLDLFFFKASQKEFVAAFVPALLLMGSRVFSTLMSPFLPALTAMGRALRNLKLAFAMALVTVPLLLLLTWQFGVLGAAASRVLAEALSAGIFGWTVIRAIGKRIGAQPAAPPVGVAGSISTDRA